MRYFLKLSYKGTSFHGWQIQPNASSVQETIENALSMILRCKIPIVGAGRTDTGVHAKEMFAHFDYPLPITDHKKFLLSLNRLVGRDISIEKLIDVHDDAHARFDATSRTYKYFITYEKTPFLYPFSWLSPSTLNADLMNESALILKDTSDFTSFAKLHSDAKTNICRVSKAVWTPIIEGDSLKGLVFTITADRFLRNMVRAIVGTLVDVGRGKLSVEDFKSIIESKDRCAAGTSMPAEALFLWKIEYPFIKN